MWNQSCFSKCPNDLNQRDLGAKAGPVQTYPDGVVLSVLLPVAAGVAEHQRVAGHPVRAPVPALRGHCHDLHSVPQINLEPLLLVGLQWGPATSSCKMGWGEFRWQWQHKKIMLDKEPFNYFRSSLRTLLKHAAVFLYFSIRKYTTWGGLPPGYLH